MERAVAVADGEARGDRREAAAERRLVRRPQPGKPGARDDGCHLMAKARPVEHRS